MLTILDSIANLIGGDLYHHILSNVRIFTGNYHEENGYGLDNQWEESEWQATMERQSFIT